MQTEPADFALVERRIEIGRGHFERVEVATFIHEFAVQLGAADFHPYAEPLVRRILETVEDGVRHQLIEGEIHGVERARWHFVQLAEATHQRVEPLDFADVHGEPDEDAAFVHELLFFQHRTLRASRFVAPTAGSAGSARSGEVHFAEPPIAPEAPVLEVALRAAGSSAKWTSPLLDSPPPSSAFPRALPSATLRAMFVPETEVLITSEGAELLRRVVTPGEYVIGRDVDCTLRVDVNLVSRQHARLTVNYHDLLLEDLGSSNGTFVNGERITAPTRIFPTQKIQIGTATLELRRRRADLTGEVSLAPATALVRRMLPVEFRGDRKYEIGRVVAHGGMGAILDARELTTGRTVAVKVMLESGQETDLLRFIQEAQITARLEHPNIVPVHELGVDEHEQVFYTMKFVRGVTLREVLKRLAAGEVIGNQKSVISPASGGESTDHYSPITDHSLPALLTVFQKVCDAIAFAHSHHIIHRDLKPENIMLGEYGEVLVMDWGLAKILGEPQTAAAQAIDTALRLQLEAAAQRDADADTGTHTLAGTIMGTPAYMPPEQARGDIDRLDERSDLYALGAILFELLHLRPIVTGRDAMDIVEKVKRGELEWTQGAAKSTSPSPPPREAPLQEWAPPAPRVRRRSGLRRSLEVPAGLLAVCRKALALDQSARYASVRELQTEIAAFEAGFATRAEQAGLGRQLLLALKRHKTAALATALVLLAGGGFGTKALLEGRRAEQALAELRSTAPNFIDQAATLVTANDLPGALKKATAATKLAPDVAEYRVFRAHLLLAIPNLRDAADEYRHALALHSDHAEAREHLALCEELLRSEPGSAKLSAGALNRIHALTVKYGRTSHAVYLLRELQGERKQLLATWRKVLEDHEVLGPSKYEPRTDLKLNDDGTFYLYVNEGATDLSALRGMPLTELVMKKTKVVDLRPLSALPLRTLKMQGTKPADFEPLRGLKLEELNLESTGIESLEPLRGMPLRKLLLVGNERVRDLSPLRGGSLAELDITGTNPVSLDPLSSLPLKKLRMGDHRTAMNISALQRTPLEDLSLGSSKIKDYAPLKGMKLIKFNASSSYDFGEISLLSGMPLEELILSGTSIVSLDALRGAPLQTLSVIGTKVSDLSPLRGMTSLRSLYLSGCPVSDLSPLGGLPLELLHLNGIRAELDLAPLLECPNLKDVNLPLAPRNLEKLRQHPSLQRIRERADGDRPDQTAAEFWKEYDAKQAAAKK